MRDAIAQRDPATNVGLLWSREACLPQPSRQERDSSKQLNSAADRQGRQIGTLIEVACYAADMSSANVRIVDLKTAPASPQLLKEIEAIFFAASGRSFDPGAERDAFHERWLGRYLWTATDVALVAVEGGNTAGYLVGCFEDPALQERFGDISYFRESFSALTKRYPAHLHINLASRYRSQGIGARLIEAFAVRATAAATRGMHVVTGQGMRNVSFYLRCGFAERATAMWNGRPIVFLARDLEADAP